MVCSVACSVAAKQAEVARGLAMAEEREGGWAARLGSSSQYSRCSLPRKQFAHMSQCI